VLKISEDILFEIACRHPFIDGNKRTALISSNLFLAVNKELYAKNDELSRRYEVKYDPKEAVIRAKQIELIADWNEDQPSEELHRFLIENGIKIRHKICETHIRQYIRKFLIEQYLEEQKH
jgi:prophage maintenance system killer protein